MEATAIAPMDLAEIQLTEAAARIHAKSALRATPYRWPNPRSLPPREWLFGHYLLRGEVTAIIAPGGTGKTTITTTFALSLASGRPLLDVPLPRGPQGVWIYNLEDGTDELERQVAAACAFHDVGPEDCGDRLYLDSGLAQPLCTAVEDGSGFVIAEDVFAQIAETVRDRNISVLIVDPFVSSHAARESSNEAINAITKRWKRLAQETGCAVVLVHHTRKLGGREVTAEDGRGAVALRDAARIVLTLNPMSEADAGKLGISDPRLRRSLVRVDTGKANRALPDAVIWLKLESQCLDNGDGRVPADDVGVATLWQKPDVFFGLSTRQLHEVQSRVAAGQWRNSAQSPDWVGHVVAEVTGLYVGKDSARIKAILKAWMREGALAVENRIDRKGNMRPYVMVGKPVELSQIEAIPHLEEWGEEGGEGGEDDPR